MRQQRMRRTRHTLDGMVTIRPADEADVAALRTIVTAAYARYVPRIGQAPAPMTADYAHAVRSGQVWVAEEQGEIVGLVVLIAQPGHLLLENVAVRPDAQGPGIGARLMALSEYLARALAINDIRLYASPASRKNVSSYPRHCK